MLIYILRLSKQTRKFTLMKKRSLIGLASIGLLFGLTFSGCGRQPGFTNFTMPVIMPAIQQTNNFHTMALPGEILVKQKDGSPLASSFFSQIGIKVIKRVNVLDINVVKVPTGVTMDAALQKLNSDPSVEYAEPNYIRKANISVNDEKRKEQFALDKIQADKAWDITMGNNSVVVAVIDTGADIMHPDLVNQVVEGYSSVRNNAKWVDDNGHGTHVAGIIAAIANNGTGIAGLAPKCKIMPVKVLDKTGSGNDAGISEAIVWAADHGASVINMSLGGPGESKTLEKAVNYALKKNVIVCAAMGNEGNNYVNYPAAYQGVIAVGATDEQDNVTQFSNYGKWIAVTAPGAQILSTFPTYDVELNQYGYSKNYAVLDGTSQATPYVSALSALVRSKFGKISPSSVMTKIKKGADDLGAAGFDEKFGYGRINAFKTLK